MTHSGGHRAAGAGAAKLPVLRLVLLVVGIVLAAVAWLVLVRAAVDFGTEARAGRDAGWAFMGLAAVGAIGCLLLALVLVVRGLTTLGLISDAAGREVGRHRG